MVKNKICGYITTEEDLRLLANLFRDPVATQYFLTLLQNIKQTCVSNQHLAANAYLMTDDPQQRSSAILHRGRAEFIDELSQLINKVNK